MADEFDDVVRHGPFVSSTKARVATGLLAREHNLSFTHNPGGGEFYQGGWRCQVGLNDELADLAELRRALETNSHSQQRGGLIGDP